MTTREKGSSFTANSDPGRAALQRVVESMRRAVRLAGHVSADTIERWADCVEAAVSPGAGWLPIESAPKDGTRVLLYACEHRRHWFGTGYYFKGVPGDGEGWIAHSFYTLPNNDSSGCFTPTHWRRMFDPPGAEPLRERAEQHEEDDTRVGETAS